MKLRVFKPAGIANFEAYLAALRADPSLAVPERLLVDDAFSEEVPGRIEIKVKQLESRFDAAKYLYALLDCSGLEQPERNKGLWAWLSLLLFDSTCPLESSGGRKPGADARHIPEVGNFLRYYRHLLLGPYIIYRANRDAPENAMALLCQKLNRPGDVVEQLSARQQRISNRTFLAVASKFYVDSAGKQRRGAQNKTRGSALRLAKVANQFDVNWYLYAMKPDEFAHLLPKEFDKFKANSS